ncbi:MAG: FadR family transcriptional regulator [Salana multivorans]|uniref:FadR/GntR family transcriptional regulator n=1 Tax=Salana multivorans TaxID=120377 RepID=UPI000AAF1E20|nr:FCD domain-containing protein [Salana multivorans]MBN8882928.1 FadR family transcriptional regulator [Salana multivorans]
MADDRSGSTMARSTLAFLRTKIVSGEWPINSRIPKEPELMELIGVGKSTVREAVRSLANLGMLETIRGVGTFVRSTSPISLVLTEYMLDYGLEDVLVFRRALEIEAAQLAALNRSEAHLAALRASLDSDLRADPDVPDEIERGTTPGQFHHLVFDAAESPLLGALYSGVMAAVRRAMNERQIVFATGQDLRRRDHAALLGAIEAQDVTRAAHAMALHVERDLVPDDGDAESLTLSLRARLLEEHAAEQADLLS